MLGIGKVLDAALKLADAGMPVFPCRADKTPTTPHGFKNAVTDSATVRELWRQRPGPLIGVPTDAVSGINLLDLDFPRHPESQTWYDQNRHRLPVTRTHGTLSSGLHLLFKHDPSVRGSAGKIVPGVDTRGSGGYLIWWSAAGLPVLSDAPLASWPDWLLAEFRPKPRPSISASSALRFCSNSWLRGLIRTVATAPEGKRNCILFWAACRAGEAIGGGKLNETLTVELLIRTAARCGLEHKEAANTVRSGVRTGLGNV